VIPWQVTPRSSETEADRSFNLPRPPFDAIHARSSLDSSIPFVLHTAFQAKRGFCRGGGGVVGHPPSNTISACIVAVASISYNIVDNVATALSDFSRLT